MPLDPDTIDGDEEIEATFRRLRREGHSRQEAVQVILDTLNVSLTEAKRVLLTSDTWAEAQTATNTFQSNATDVPEDISDQSTPPPAPG